MLLTLVETLVLGGNMAIRMHAETLHLRTGLPVAETDVLTSRNTNFFS